MSSYGAPLAQRASYLALHGSLFGPLIMIILSLTALTLCQDVFPMAHTLTIVEPNWPMLQNISKTLIYIYIYIYIYIFTCTSFGFIEIGFLPLLYHTHKQKYLVAFYGLQGHPYNCFPRG